MNEIIFEEITQRLSREDIIRKAKENNEFPFGYILEYIRDEYNIAKMDGYPIATEICDFYAF